MIIKKGNNVGYKVDPEFEEDVQIFVDRADNFRAILHNKFLDKGLTIAENSDDELIVKIDELTDLIDSSYLFKTHEDLEEAEKKLNEIRGYISELR